MIYGLRRARLAGAFLYFASATVVAAMQGCSGGGPPVPAAKLAETPLAAKLAETAPAVSAADPLPCAASLYAVASDTGNITVNSSSVVDSYSSSAGPYGGSNVASNAVVQSAGSIIGNGGVILGNQRQNAPAGFATIPAAAGAVNLPLGSSSRGSLNINNASQSLTLAPGDYVVANLSVNFPGSINISPAGQVRIWVTGNLNLGGTENGNGAPTNLAFLVTSSNAVNVNAGGALFGTIYAPTSPVNVNSPIFGSVVGGSVILNSNAAVHFDESAECAQASASPNPSGPVSLPAPPTAVGCYVGTLNGWLLVDCADPTTVLPGFQHFDVSLDGVAFDASNLSNPTGPLVYGQVETTVVHADSESNDATSNTAAGTPTGPNQWSVQNNTNGFSCNGGSDRCAVQFTAGQDGETGNAAICITSADLPCAPGGGCAVTYDTSCVGVTGTTVQNMGSISPFNGTRQGPLVDGDFATIAGYTFTQGTTAMVGMVVQISWIPDPAGAVAATATDVLHRIPGLYAVVANDTFGLAGHWTTVTGGIMGEDNGTVADFMNAEVFTRVSATSCPGDISASGPTCSDASVLSASNVQFTNNPKGSATNPKGVSTVETSNLNLVETPTPSFPNTDLVVTDVLASTNTTGTTTSCLSTTPNHLFVRDTEGDSGGVPSNAGGVPFWESPDIFIVPAGLPAPKMTDTPADIEVTAGLSYSVYLRVHNDFGCQPIAGPIQVFIDEANPDMGFQNWQAVTTDAAAGQYESVASTSSAPLVPAFGAQMLGPFPWMPLDSGHKCLIAAVAASNETKPTVTIKTGQPVLPPAYSSNQIAQRNVQISQTCSYNITNNSSDTANLLLGISVSPSTPAPGSNGLGVSLLFTDMNKTFFNAWNGQQGISVMNVGDVTTVALGTSYVALNTVPLATGQSPHVSINIEPGNNTPPSVNVSSLLTDPLTGDILSANGGTCQSTGMQIVIQ